MNPFALYAPRIFVVSHAHKFDVQDMVSIHPIEKFGIGSEFGSHPDARFHLRSGESFTLPPAPRIREILEGARVRDEGPEK
jgi:hypothetical protein